MQLISEKISVKELEKMSEKTFGRLVKAVVDIEKNIMVVDADLHSDQEHFLLEEGSNQKELWGINLHPDKFGSDDFVEFDSMINLRPSWGNKTRGVDNPEDQKMIRALVKKMVTQ